MLLNSDFGEQTIKEDVFLKLPIINNLPQDFDFQFVTVFQNSHIFLAEEKSNSNDVFHYIRDGDQFVLLFKHDYADFNELDSTLEEDIQIVDMRSLESIKTLLILYSNGTLKTFNLPDLIYNYKADLQNIKQIEVIDEDRCLTLSNGGVLNIHTFSKQNDRPKLENHFFMKDVKHLGTPIIKSKNEIIFLIVNEMCEYQLVNTKYHKQDQFKPKTLFAFNDSEFIEYFKNFLCKLGDNQLLYLKPNNELAVINCDGSSITQLQLKGDMAAWKHIDTTLNYIEIGNDLKVFTTSFDDLNKSDSSISKVIEIDNNFYFDWDLLRFSKEGKSFLEDIMSKYLLQPLLKEQSDNPISVEIRMEQEKFYIEKNMKFESKSLVILKQKENSSLMALLESPMTVKLKNFDFETIELCDKAINELSLKQKSESNKIEVQYARYYKLLLLLFHNEVLDISCFKTWLSIAIKKDSDIDLKLLFYILNWVVYGDIWVYKGLFKIVEKLKILKLENKIREKSAFVAGILSSLAAERESPFIKDIHHLKLSATLKYIELILQEKPEDPLQETLNIIDFELFGDKVISFIEKQKESSFNIKVLIYFYEKKNIITKVLDLLSKVKDYDQMQTVFVLHFKEIVSKQEQPLLLDQITMIINNKEHVSENLLKDLKNYIKDELRDSLSIRSFINGLNNNSVKFMLLENIIQKSKNLLDIDTVSFTLDFYILEIENITLKNQVFTDTMITAIDDFTIDKDFKNKFTIEEYINELFQKNKQLTNMKLKWISFQESLDKIDESKKSNDLIESRFYKKFTNNFIIYLFFGMDKSLKKEELFAYYLQLNDFKSLSNILNLSKDQVFDSMFLKVIENYTNDEFIFLKFMKKYNARFSSELSLRIIELIPVTFKLTPLNDFIKKSISKLQSIDQLTSLEIGMLKYQEKEKSYEN